MLPGIPTGDIRLGTLGTSASGTSLSVPYPTLVRSDDILVLICGALSATLYTSLGGSWTDDCRHSGTTDTLSPGLYVAHRQGLASLSGTNLTVTCPNVQTRGRILAVPAVDLASILDTLAATTFKDQTVANNANIVPAGTLARQQGLLVGGWIDNTGAHTWVQPTNWSQQNAGDGTVPLEIAYFLQAALGTTGTITSTIAAAGTGKSLGQVLCLRPRPVNPLLVAA